MTRRLQFLLVMLQACLYSSSIIDVHGRVGCEKSGVFHRLEGLRVAIYGEDIFHKRFNDFINSTVTNKNGEFALFARDDRTASWLYVWMALSCDFIIREKIFEGCIKTDSDEPIQQQCMEDTALNFIYARRIFEKKDELLCDLKLDIGDFSILSKSRKYGPQTEILTEAFQGNIEQERKRCGFGKDGKIGVTYD